MGTRLHSQSVAGALSTSPRDPQPTNHNPPSFSLDQSALAIVISAAKQHPFEKKKKGEKQFCAVSRFSQLSFFFISALCCSLLFFFLSLSALPSCGNCFERNRNWWRRLADDADRWFGLTAVCPFRQLLFDQ